MFSSTWNVCHGCCCCNGLRETTCGLSELSCREYSRCMYNHLKCVGQVLKYIDIGETRVGGGLNGWGGTQPWSMWENRSVHLHCDWYFSFIHNWQHRKEESPDQKNRTKQSLTTMTSFLALEFEANFSHCLYFLDEGMDANHNTASKTKFQPKYGLLKATHYLFN